MEDAEDCYEVDRVTKKRTKNKIDRITKKETSKKKVEVIELLDDDTGPSVMDRASASAEETKKTSLPMTASMRTSWGDSRRMSS